MHTFIYSIRIIKNLIITGLIDNYVLLFAPDFSWYMRNVVPTLFLDTFYSVRVTNKTSKAPAFMTLIFH